MGVICSCCKPVDVRNPMMNITTALDLDLDNDFEIKRASRDSKLMNIACEVNIFNDKQRSYKHNIFDILDNSRSESKKVSLNIPRIVVVGTQTSGKSSLVNRMIGMDLLPTGNNMVTRSPIYIEITNCRNDDIPSISLSCIDEGREILFYQEKIAILMKDVFREKIKEITLKMTGSEYSITKSPIVIKLSLINASPLFLVDLPGLVAIARTEKGQRENIVSDIENLVREQLLIPNTYAIVAIQSKIDMETDMGLSIVKKIQREKSDLKAFGILTKPDLLDKRTIADFDTLIGDNLTEKSISTDMGFYVINNIKDDYQWYEDYFGKKSKIIKTNKYGTRNFLVAYRKKITSSIFSELSSIKEMLTLLKDRLITLCPHLGNEIKEPHEKQLFIDSNLHILVKLISNSIESLGNKFNIGPEIKDIISTMWKEIDRLMPFSEVNMGEDELKRIINSFDGFTQTGQSRRALIISRCLENKEKMPVGNIINKIKVATDAIKKSILNLVNTLLDERKLDIQADLNYYSFQIREFPKLKELIIKSISKILNKYEKEVHENVEKSLIIQEPSRRSMIDKESYNTNILLVNKIAAPSARSSAISFVDGRVSKPQNEMINDSFDGSLDGSNAGSFSGSKGCSSNGFAARPTTDERSDLNNPLLGVSGTNGISIFDIQEKEETLTVKEIRNLLILSFEQIAKIAKENAIKAIETLQLRKFQERAMNDILKELKEYYKKFTIDNLFFESDEIAERNTMYIEFIADINKILEMIDKIDK